MPVSKVWVEIAPDGVPIRIIRLTSEVWKLSPEIVRQWPKAEAVRSIREQVFARCRGFCQFCGVRVTRETGEMHERIPKGSGGEVSLTNSVFICHGCHTGRPDSEHGNRRWGGRQA